MKAVAAYMSVDGLIFADEDEAIKHDEDCIGQEIDELLAGAIAACNGNVTRNDQFRMALHLLKNKKELSASVAKLHYYLNEQKD